MRDQSFDSQSFCIQLDRLMKSQDVRTLSAELLSRITPNGNSKFLNEFVIRRRDKNVLVLLAIFSWYAPEEIGILLRLNLERFSTSSEFWFLAIMLESKGSMLNFLTETRLWSTRDFFGNILNERRLKSLKYYLSPLCESKKRPKRVIRHRGYRDKGSLRISSDKHDLFTGSREQQKIEEQREVLHDSYLFLRGFILGG